MGEKYSQIAVTGNIKSYNVKSYNKSVITLIDSANICVGTRGTVYTKNGLVRFKVADIISDTELEIDLLIDIGENDPIMFINDITPQDYDVNKMGY